MGRRSCLAPLLIEFGGLAQTAFSMSDAEPATSALRCPKQLMSLPLPASIRPRRSSKQAAHKRSNESRFGFQHADARALPFADGSFDRAFSMLVLQFIPDVEHAVAEMRRVLRPAGRVTAAVWDGFDGTPVFRLLLDTAAVLAPTIRVDFAGFDDYGLPLESRGGPTGLYLAALSDEARATLQEHVRRGLLCNRLKGAALVCGHSLGVSWNHPILERAVPRSWP
jgi:SAM-dependent methyltransferase